MNELSKLWEIHQDAAWPDSLGTAEGELMMLDTVIAGCITYFIQESQLDPQRVGILQDSLAELNELFPELPDQAVGYFERLRTLGSSLLDTIAE